MRCFVAIPLPTGTRLALAEAAASVRRDSGEWRGEKWVAQTNLHVTLAFLGDLPEGTIAPLVAELGFAIGAHREFELRFAGLHAVPSARRAHMLWARYDDDAGLCGALAADVCAVATGFGVALEDRPFSAHVTLARARRPRRLGEHAQTALHRGEQTVPEFMSVSSATLFASQLTRQGPQYTVVDSWRLEG